VSADLTSPSASPAIPFLDIFDPNFDSGSAEVARAREASWYAQSPLGLLVLRYAQIQELLKDPRLDHNGKGYMEMNGVFDGPIFDWFVPMIVNQDGAEHRRLRGLVNRAFTPRMISDLRPFIRATVERLADRLRAMRTCEFVEDFANSLPLAVMCQLLGVPEKDFESFRAWTTDISLVFSLGQDDGVRARVEAAVIGLNEYAESLIQDKAAAPADDLVSALVEAQRVEHRVSAEELRNLVVTLVFAAHDTTRHQLSNAMVAFADHPDQWRLLGNHPELAEQAVEEVMRWCPASNTAYRCAAVDFDYQGLHLTKGTFLTMCVIPAQRDPRAFENGDAFDISIRRSTPTLQFGGGPHYCLGAALARAELCEALPALATRLGPPTIIGPLSWRPPLGVLGPHALPLRFG
jgi:cytochrome P450